MKKFNKLIILSAFALFFIIKMLGALGPFWLDIILTIILTIIYIAMSVILSVLRRKNKSQNDNNSTTSAECK